MNKFNLIANILQIAGGLVLAGVAVYYFVTDNFINGIIFLAVGVFFIAMPVRNFLKARKQKKEEEEKNNNSSGKKGFL